MKSLTKINHILIFYTLILVILIGAFVLFSLYINEKKVSAAVILSDIEMLKNQNSRLQDLNSVLKDIKEDQNKLNSYFVSSDEIIDFLEAVEKIGQDSGAEVEVHSIDEVETSNPLIDILTLNLTAKGNWESVYHFLILIQNYPVRATFDRIHMSTARTKSLERDENAEEDEWRGVFNMKVLELKK